MNRTLLIINPISGQWRVNTAKAQMLERLGSIGPLEVFETTGPGDATAAARRAVETGVRRVVVAGGDGTVNEVVNGLAGSDVLMGLVPLGTANVLARELDIPLEDVDAACGIIQAGRVTKIDLAKCDGQYFVLMAGIGFDAAVVNNVDPKIKDIFGPAAYGISGATELLRHKPSKFSINIDGVTYETEGSMVVVANVSSYAIEIKVARHAIFNDGWLDVCVFEKSETPRIGLLSQALRLVLLGSIPGDPSITCFKGKKVSITCEPPAFVQIDGDVVGKTPTEIEVFPNALRMIVPKL